jgi:hemoglobin-like flavoprotein
MISVGAALSVGLAVYIISMQQRLAKEVETLDGRVRQDLELRRMRFHNFVEAQKIDLGVLAQSHVVQGYFKNLSHLTKIDYNGARSYLDGKTSNRDKFVELFTDFLTWGKLATNSFNFENLYIVNGSGEILLSVKHANELGTNIESGLLANSGAALTFEQIRQKRDFCLTQFDQPSDTGSGFISIMGAPLASPIGDNRFVGAVIAEVSANQLRAEIGGRGILNYQHLLFQSNKVRISFEGFDSTQNSTSKILTRQIAMDIPNKNDQMLVASIDEDANVNVNPTYSVVLGLISGLTVLLIGLFVFKIYANYADKAVSSTNATIVQSVWASIIDNPEKVGRDFYRNLFQTPEIAAVFTRLGHAPDLPKKLVSMMSLIVNNSDRMDIIESEIFRLASMHMKMGVRPEHVPTFIAAFLRTVEQQYDGDFSPKLKQAWLNVLNEVGRIFVSVLEHEKKRSVD